MPIHMRRPRWWWYGKLCKIKFWDNFLLLLLTILEWIVTCSNLSTRTYTRPKMLNCSQSFQFPFQWFPLCVAITQSHFKKRVKILVIHKLKLHWNHTKSEYKIENYVYTGHLFLRDCSNFLFSFSIKIVIILLSSFQFSHHTSFIRSLNLLRIQHIKREILNNVVVFIHPMSVCMCYVLRNSRKIKLFFFLRSTQMTVWIKKRRQNGIQKSEK